MEPSSHVPDRQPRRRPLANLARCLGRIAFLLIVAAAGLARAAPTSPPALDLVFVIDTTGSMAGEIREAKERVHQVAAALRDARGDHAVRMGVVAFRDRGDRYVTRVSPLDADVEPSYRFLAGLDADGGGDGPEDVLAGLHAALTRMEWRRTEGVDRQIFLIGDAPAHLDYADGPRVEEIKEIALRLRVVVNTIGCRSLPGTGIEFFRWLAYATEGRYQHIGRVKGEEPAFADALIQAALPAERGAGRAHGTTVFARLDRDRSGAPGENLLVRLWSGQDSGRGEAGGGDAGSDRGAPGPLPGASSPSAPQACLLVIGLPSGVRLEGSPRLTLEPDRLRVELDLQAGEPEGASVYTLDPCVPAGTPVHTAFGGLP